MKRLLVIPIIGDLVLAGCTDLTTRQIYEGNTVSVESALTDIGTGFAKMTKALGDRKLGLYPCRISIQFNVTAGANEDNKLVINPTPGTNVTATLGGTSNASRGNTVNIDMYNPGCMPEKTLGYEKPDKVKTTADGMRLIDADGKVIGPSGDPSPEKDTE